MTTDLVRLTDSEVLATIANLYKAGVIDDVSLNITDPDTPFEQWLGFLRLFGTANRSLNWWIGDALNFGEKLYGENAAQAIESTTKERYDLMERVTGMERQTLMNIASIAGRIARERRRPELLFWIHGIVAKLEPEEQVMWLQRTVDEGWHTSDLKAAIKAATGQEPPAPVEGDEPEGLRLSVSERVAAAAKSIWKQAQDDPDPEWVRVPRSALVQLGAALGEKQREG